VNATQAKGLVRPIRRATETTVFSWFLWLA